MDSLSRTQQASLEIDRPADDLYDLIADVSQMGRWSPMCTGGRYDEDGVWFTGTNATGHSTWETRCRVVAAERGKEFAFVNYGLEGKAPLVRWGFRFEALDLARTNVTQTWEVLPSYAEGTGMDEDSAMAVLNMMQAAAQEGMPVTLAALKADTEGQQ